MKREAEEDWGCGDNGPRCSYCRLMCAPRSKSVPTRRSDTNYRREHHRWTAVLQTGLGPAGWTRFNTTDGGCVRPLLPLTRHCRSARLFGNRTVPVEATVISRRPRSPEIRWGRDSPNDGTANGSAGVNCASDLGGQRCGNHEDRGDSTGNRRLAEHLSLLGPNPPSIAGGARPTPERPRGTREY